MKKCPFCAEEIQDEAIFCKHCRQSLPAATTGPAPTPTSEAPAMFSGVTAEPGSPLERDATSGTGTTIAGGCGLVLFVLMGSCAALIGIGVLFPSSDQESPKQASTSVASSSTTTPAKRDSYSGTSPTCGPVSGQTEADLKNVMDFCAKGISKDVVVGAYATGPLLWVKVNEQMAREMTADPLVSEQLVKLWMTGWRVHSGERVVTVTVEWGSVEIAEGQTTVFSGDQVTMRQR